MDNLSKTMARQLLSDFTQNLFAFETTDHSEEDHSSHETIEQILLLVPFCLLLGNIVRQLCIEFRIPFPYTVLLLLVGMLLGWLESQFDMGLLGTSIDSIKHMSPHLLLSAFVAPLVFESAFSTDYHVIKREFGLVAIFCRFVWPYDWRWSEAIAFGAIVSATDPVAVVSLLRELGASKRLATLIEGESLLNDGSSFVMFTIAMQFVQSMCVLAQRPSDTA